MKFVSVLLAVQAVGYISAGSLLDSSCFLRTGAVGSLTAVVPNLSKSFMGNFKDVVNFTGHLKAIITVVESVAQLVVQLVKAISAVLSRVTRNINSLSGPLGKDVTKSVGDLVGKVGNALNDVVRAVGDVLNDVTDNVKDLLVDLEKYVQNLVSAIKYLIVYVAKIVGDLLNKVSKIVDVALCQLQLTIQSVVQIVDNVLTELLAKLLGSKSLSSIDMKAVVRTLRAAPKKIASYTKEAFARFPCRNNWCTNKAKTKELVPTTYAPTIGG